MLFLRRVARPGSRQGQALIIVALMFVVLFGFAGLALDAGHVFLVHRNAQNAADAAALAAGKRLVGALQTGPPASSSNAAVKAGHDFTASNGFTTVFSAVCDASTPGSPNRFRTSWFDVNTGTCAAPVGFQTRVDVFAPPRTLVSNCTSQPYNCLEVVVTQNVQNYLMGVLGQPTTTVTASAATFGDPAGFVATVPPPIALYIYEAGVAPGLCTSGLGQQCFDQTKVPARSGLTCKAAAANCPALWVQAGSRPLINGVNGNLLSPPADTVGTQSNGDIVLQDATGTTFCDAFAGPCSSGVLTGLKGFAINTATTAKLYCSGSTPLLLAPTACTTAGPGAAPLGPVVGNEVAFTAQTWTPVVDTSGLPLCGALVLNGETVASHYGAPGIGCAPLANEPYTIKPGQYSSIVINHGIYTFGGGMFHITGNALVNTNLTGTANGIDHSNENSAGNPDWDLCPAGSGVTGCALTAGVWIGHGSMASTPYAPPVLGSCPTPGDEDGGGGDITAVTGTGVTFVFDATSNGFVSTREVNFISLSSPGLGAQPAVQGAPLLFYMSDAVVVHLDASGGATPSQFRGLIYQVNTAKYGGVEVNPGLGAGQAAAVGQVWAYSFTTFGTPGIALDFSNGYGGAAGPPLFLATGNNEPEILTSAGLQAAPTPQFPPGYEQLVMTYNDEWKLDAYSVNVSINGRAPVLFSQGLWAPTPVPAGTPLPPPTGPGSGFTNPGEGAPAEPAPAQDVNLAYTINTLAPKPDWTMNYPNKTSPTSWFQVTGDWTWGHQQSIPGAVSGNYNATLVYSFPIPPGQSVVITAFMSDGDHCGDFVTATWIFNNIGQASPGLQVIGTVHLVQ